MWLGELYNKYQNGEPLTDEELKVGRERFGKLMTNLEELGPVFRLQANEIRRVYLGFVSYIEARKER